jgi:hypothetical protein
MNRLAIIVVFLFCNELLAQNNHEKLVFELRFGFIKGGEAVYQISETAGDNGNEIHAILHGYTTGLANKLYAVDDRFESFISKEHLLPSRALKQLKEQSFRFDEEVTFNHNEEMAFSNNSGWRPIKSGICDVSSLMYHLRYSGKLDQLNLNQIIEIPFWDTDEWYMLKLKYTGIEKIKSPFGTIACLRLEPQEIAGRFFNKKNPINIWVSNDVRRLPVLMELNFTIGSVKCELTPPPPACLPVGKEGGA